MSSPNSGARRGRTGMSWPGQFQRLAFSCRSSSILEVELGVLRCADPRALCACSIRSNQFTRRAENAAAIVAAAMRANGDAMNSLVPDLSETPPPLPHRGLPPVPFGPAPLIEGEDAAAYDEFLVRISCAVRPVDIFEEIWVR